jgi:hypothetical protein
LGCVAEKRCTLPLMLNFDEFLPPDTDEK